MRFIADFTSTAREGVGKSVFIFAWSVDGREVSGVAGVSVVLRLVEATEIA